MARAKKMAAEQKASTGDMVTVTLPLAEPEGYVSGRIDLTLSGLDKHKIGRLRQGLINAGAFLPSGKLVDSNADVMRYVLAQVAGE